MLKQKDLTNLATELDAVFRQANAFKDEGGYQNAKAQVGKEKGSQAIQRRIKDNFRYVNGELPPPYKEGSAQSVYNVCGPKVNKLTAALCEIFDTNSNTVSYKTYDQAMIPLVSVANEFIKKQLEQVNFGNTLQAALSESLIAGASYLKAWWNDELVERTETYVGLTDDEIKIIEGASPDHEFIKLNPKKITRNVPQYQIDPNTGQEVQVGVEKITVTEYDVVEKYQERKNGLEVVWTPTHEIFTLPDENDIKTASYFAHRKHMYRYEIREEFPQSKFKKVIDSAGAENPLNEIDTNIDVNSVRDTASNYGITTERDRIYLTEHYIRFKGALYQVFTAGQMNAILDCQEVDEIPFFVMNPLRDANSLWPLSVVDHLRTPQDVLSALIRGKLDNIANANNGRYLAVKNQYDRKALLDNRAGGVVEENAPGMINLMPYHAIPNGLDTTMAQALQLADELTGSSNAMSQAGEKLLSNPTATGAALAASIAEIQEKNLARNVVLTCLEPFYRYLYQLSRKNIRKTFFRNVEGQEVEVQPAMWPREIDIEVDIITKQDKQTKAINIDAFTRKVAELRQTSMSPDEWYGQATQLAEALEIPEVLHTVLRPDQIQPPQPTKMDILSEKKVEADILESQSRMYVADREATTKENEIKYKFATLQLEAVKAGESSDLKQAQLQMERENAIANRRLEAKKSQLDAFITVKFGKNFKIGS